VYTDWLVVQRLAAELDRAVRSARIRDVGLTADGRFALRVRARGAGGDAVVIDPFGDTPIVVLEHEVELEAKPGWSRAIADAVQGMRIERVRARRGDRLIAIDLATISRFGVLSAYRLVAELVPRFGNLLLLKSDAIVAAAREFTPQQNPRRPIAVGDPYQPPPLPEPKASRPELIEALRVLLAEPSPVAQAAASRVLRACLPLLPQLVAASLVSGLTPGDVATPAELAGRLIESAERLLEAAEGDPDLSREIYVYRNGSGRLVQAHPLPLAQFAALTGERRGSMLTAVAEVIRSDRESRTAQTGETRRTTLLARVRRRLERLEAERGSLEALLTNESPERLRVEGDLLYAHHADVAAGADSFAVPGDPAVTIALDPQLDAKGNAAAIFKRYRKSINRRAHAERRLGELGTQIAAAEELAWELERADISMLEELADDADETEQRSRPAYARTQPRRNALEVTLAEDARVLVGRSPKNNAELTFRIARPDDLWFHARGVPGAHVVLRIDSARAPTIAEVQSAAELAAYHSKARTSGIVPVDYTARKHVRKQQNALPGLVWYTDAKTIDVSPRPIDNAH
jgi:predicted ribosome quality control (RQC) complex YloA/Tae2 family protein